MAWLFDDRNELPKELNEAIARACQEPGALGPATKASVSAVILMLTRLAAVAEKRVTDIERKFAMFDPLQYKDRECGRRTLRMQLTDGREAVLTTEITSANGETLVERASRVDKLEWTARELESQLQVLQQQLSAAHRRIAALERAKESQ